MNNIPYQKKNDAKVGDDIMTNEQIYEACDYIRTHKPQKTKFETIDMAIRAVTKNYLCACTKEELVNRDDAWLVPNEERGIFAGVKKRGGAEGFTSEILKLFDEATEYAIEHASEIREESQISNIIDSKEKLKEMKDELLDYNLNVYNKKDSNMDINDINKIPKF